MRKGQSGEEVAVHQAEDGSRKKGREGRKEAAEVGERGAWARDARAKEEERGVRRGTRNNMDWQRARAGRGRGPTFLPPSTRAWSRSTA